MVTNRFFVALAAAGTLISATPVLAQSSDASNLTAEQLQELFAKQKTRGLVLATPSTQTETDETTTAATTTTATTEDATTTTTATTTVATTTQVANATPDYVELAEEEQVNIQVSFDFDSAALREDQKPKLTALCQAMQASGDSVFRIVGHTDSSGSANYNERLSLLRAEEVKRYLVGDCGIAETQLQAVGVGEQFPFDKDNPRADENRRVEFQALS